jgi:single-strand DNA-binding protein
MNALKNNVRLIGNLGEDPQIRKFDNGRMVANFSIATDEVYTNSEGEKVKETNWHRLVAWGRPAEVAEKYLKKGSGIAVDGRLTNRSYEDKSGEKHYVTEVIVNNLLMLDKK